MKQKDLIQKINDAANFIHNKNIRGSANYIVCSATASELLEQALNPEEHKRKQREKKLKRILNSVLEK